MDDILKDFKNYVNRDSNGAEAARREKIKKGRTNFRQYCNLINPAFFKPSRRYQDTICNSLQDFYENKIINPLTNKPYNILIMNIPPGFGKSYTASVFATWLYGQNVKNQIIECSYNQSLSVQFSKTVRDLVNDSEINGEPDYFTVKSFFPNVKIKYGDSGMERWSLEGYYNSYLATSFDGSITGMRGTVGIIDDPIKNAEEAVNENVKLKHWFFYKNTFSSRILDGGKQIIIQTRWATDDLAGMLLTEFPERCYLLSMQALDENGKSLCEDLYSTDDLLEKSKTLDGHIWQANYMQVPVDIKGALYGDFKTYEYFGAVRSAHYVNSDAAERFIAYTDTADEGADFLCCICGAVIGRYGYITDIYYTDKPMEITEPETARVLAQSNIREALIESNNGGRGFARNVERHLKSFNAKRCNVTWFSQTKNKKARIAVNAANVMEQIIMPVGWKEKFPEFYKAITTYQRKGKNKHDDAADALTGFVEMLNGEIKGKQKAIVGDRVKFPF